jgi:polysaccharide biosynthesis/export protein
MKYRMIVLLLCLPVFVTGCALAPGYQTPEEIPPDVVFTPITGELIAKLSAESEPGGSGVTAPQGSAAREYRVGPHDVLSITIWDYPGLEVSPEGFGETRVGGYVVAENGTIFFPFAGNLRVAGKTPAQIRRMLAGALASTILNPQIDVKVSEYRSRKVYVTGEVATPGQQPISDMPLTILDAITLAGGPTENADLTRVSLTQGGQVSDLDVLALLRDGELHRNIVLQNGDIVHVPDNSLRKVYVIGEVGRQSSLIMKDRRMSLTEAISDVGGINPISSQPARIYVIRGNATEPPQVYQLNAEDPIALVLGDHFLLKPRDVVYVDTSGITRWSRVLNQILPTVTFFGQPNLVEQGN